MVVPKHRENLMLAGAPALLAYDRPREEALAQGTVLVYHGLGASKEANIEELESLAAHGFVAVGIDAVGHGARAYDDFDARFDAGEAELERQFIDVVRESAEELPGIIDVLAQKELARSRGPIGVAGISMGGYIAFAAPRADKRVQAIAAISASPEWKASASSSPHLQPEKFASCAVLSFNGAKDTVVDPAPARRFHDALAPYYASFPERLAHVEFEEGDHLLAQYWADAWARSLAWMQKFLARP